MKREEIEKYKGQHVRITYVDGHTERVFLHDVGYQGFRVMVKGERYLRASHADVVKIVPKSNFKPVEGTCGQASQSGESFCCLAMTHHGSHIYQGI